MPLGRLVDGFLGGAGRAQVDDQEGVDEGRGGRSAGWGRFTKRSSKQRPCQNV